MTDKRIDSVAFEEAIKEIASKMPKNIGDVGGVSWSDVKGRPTKVSELTNDVKYQTEAQVNDTVKKVVGNAPAALDTLEEIAERLKEDSDAMTAINSILNDKANRSEIPTNVSALNNDSGFLTSVSWSGIGDKPKTIAGYGITDAKIVNGVITIGNQSITPLTSHQSLSGYAKTTDIPTKTSQLTNDSGYLTVNTKDGVVEVGRYFDFHTTNYFGKDGKPDEDYTVRIDGGTTTDKRVFTFPSAGGMFATESFVKNNDVTKSISYRLGDGVSATSGNKRWIRIAKATDATASALINLCNSYFDENSDCVLLYVNKGYNVGDANSVIQQLGGRGGTKIFTKARWVVKSHTEEAYLEVYYDCTSGRNTLLINATNVHKMEFYTTPTDGEIPSGYRVVSEIDLTKGIVSDSFKKIGGTSSQFLKADGSVDSNSYVISDQAVLRSVNGYIRMQGTDAMFFNSNRGFELYHFACEDPESESESPGYLTGYLASTNSVYIQTINPYVEEAGDLYFNDRKVITEANQKTLLPIAIEVKEDGGIYVVNHEQLTKAGLVPYIFRKTKKSNSYRNDSGSLNDNTGRRYNVRTKGWNVRGVRQSTRIGEDGRIEFTPPSDIRPKPEYYSDANSLVDIYRHPNGPAYVCWGSSHIWLGNSKKSDFLDERKDNIYAFDKYIVLHFGIAFGKPIKFGKKITLADMSTPLAQFTLRPETKHRDQQNPKGYPFLGFRFSK